MYALIVSAVGCTSGGKTSKTTMKLTQDTATMPMGMYHFPSVNGPGWSLVLPEVILRNMGVTYETYSPITDALYLTCEKR